MQMTDYQCLVKKIKDLSEKSFKKVWSLVFKCSIFASQLTKALLEELKKRK